MYLSVWEDPWMVKFNPYNVLWGEQNLGWVVIAKRHCLGRRKVAPTRLKQDLLETSAGHSRLSFSLTGSQHSIV